MLRVIQTYLQAMVAGLSDFAGEATATERWRCHPLDRSLGEFAARWDGLNRRLFAGHPMLDGRFVDGLLRHFGDGGEYLCLLEQQGKDVGMGIFKRTRPGAWASFLPAQTQMAPFILGDARDLPGLVPALPGLAGQVDLLCQDPLFSPAFHCREIPSRRQPHALTMNIRLEGDFDAYWALRPKSLRANMRTRENRLAKTGLEPRLVRVDTPAAMREAVRRFAALETSGWKGRAGTALGSDCVQAPFYGDVMERFAETGQSLVCEYWLADSLAASQLAIASKDMLVLLKTTYDEAFAYYSPGRLLLREIIRDAFLRFPGGIVEFYTNADSDQLAWATDQRWIEHISLYRNRAVEQAISAFQATRRFTRSLIQKPAAQAAGPG